MDIRKIIKEEIDGFDWVKDVEPIDISNGNYHIDVRGMNEFEKLEIQKILLQKGYRWGRSERTPKPHLAQYDCSAYVTTVSASYGKRITSAPTIEHYNNEYVIINGKKYTYINGRSLLLVGINESNDFDWVKSIKTSNTEKLIDLINKSLNRLPVLYSDREDKFSYGWINQVRTSLQFIYYDDKTDNPMIGPAFLYELITMVIRSLGIIRKTVSTDYEYHDDIYEEAREKIEDVKDHLDYYLNTNSVNLP